VNKEASHYVRSIHSYSALGPVLAGTRAQSGDRYGSGTLYPGQVLRGRLPLLSPYVKLFGGNKIGNLIF
jgi:hypothetical protein